MFAMFVRWLRSDQYSRLPDTILESSPDPSMTSKSSHSPERPRAKRLILQAFAFVSVGLLSFFLGTRSQWNRETLTQMLDTVPRGSLHFIYCAVLNLTVLYLYSSC